jgi:hypothetical protein
MSIHHLLLRALLPGSQRIFNISEGSPKAIVVMYSLTLAIDASDGRMYFFSALEFSAHPP